MASNVVSSGSLLGPGDLTLNTSTQQAPLGARLETGAKMFRYCLAGAVALVPGKLQQSAAETTAHQNLTAVAAAIGDFTIAASTTITTTANQYAEGFIVVTVTPGQGYVYSVSGHAAYTGAAPSFTTLDPVVVALTTSSRLDLVANPYKSVIVNPTTATSAAVGGAVSAVTAAQYGYIQVGGPCALLADGALTVGVNVSASNAVAGAVEAAVTAQGALGIAMTGVTDTEYGPILLSLH